MQVFRPYPGVVLAVCGDQSALIGAPADAFKATKSLCQSQGLPFPRTLVAPPVLLAHTVPQFVPEFFLYDYLFVHGAAFDARRRQRSLQFVMHAPQIAPAKQALRMTLTGPDASELQQMAAASPGCGLDAETIAFLAAQSAHMAIKVEGVRQSVEQLVSFSGFDATCCARLLDGQLAICQAENNSVVLRHGDTELQLELQRPRPIVPWCALPPPAQPARPHTLAVQTLGCRSGFDLSGPTTGFLLWINGRALLLDGPPGTTTLLAQQGIALSDLDGIILSHCHEDHMGAFIEMVLCGRRLKVYTSEPIYRSALVKLAGYLDISPAAAAQYIEYVRIVPEQPLELLGAQLTFFYTVHAIPTLGLRIELERHGRRHAVQISGDHMHHAGLLQMRERGQLSAARYQRMRSLVPAHKESDSLYFVDAGEALIHGHPGDFTRNPNQVVFYHCPDNDYTRSFGRPVTRPGDLHVLVEEPRSCQVLPARLLQALYVLGLRDPADLTTLLHSGRYVSLRTDAALSPGDQLGVVLSGQLGERGAPPWPEQTWGAGEMFGRMGPHLTLHPAEKRALTPAEVLLLDGDLLALLIQRQGQQARLQRLCDLRNGRLALPFDVEPAWGMEIRRHADVCRLDGEHDLGDDVITVLDGQLHQVGAALQVALGGTVQAAAWCLRIDGALFRRLRSLGFDPQRPADDKRSRPA